MLRCAAVLLGAVMAFSGSLAAAQVSTDLRVVATDDGMPDPGLPLSYAWSLASGPAGGTAAFTPSAGVANPTVTLDAPGTYILEVSVGDGHLTTAQRLVLTVQGSPVAAFIGRFYQECLGRSPDDTGLAAWRRDLVSGAKGGGAVARGFVLSPEFRQRNLADGPFVDLLYRAFFAREPDAGGRSVWLAELGRGVLREDLLDGFILAPEFSNLCRTYVIEPQDAASARSSRVRGFVRRFYQQCLSREPDAAGINDWTVSLLEGSRTGAAVARGFALSPEFLNRRVDDATFLGILYQAFFDRAGDVAGVAGWTAQLQAGIPRARVLEGFIGATEFRLLCARFGIIADATGG